MRRCLLALAAAGLLCASCAAPEVVDGHGTRVPAAGGASASSPTGPGAGKATSAKTPSAPTSVTPAAGVEPALALLQRLRRAAGTAWVGHTDARTRTSFALPTRVTPRTKVQNGVSQRQYIVALTKQSGVSVSYIRLGSAAAAEASLRLYPTQLQRSFRALGADDATVTERSNRSVDGHTAVTFRFAFTPTTPPQLAPVWLVDIVASGADVVLLQTVVFPATQRYDYLPVTRQVQRKLQDSLRLPG